MGPMLAASVAMWALIFERLRTYRRFGGRDISSREALQLAAGGGELEPGAGLRRQLVGGFLQKRTGLPAVDELVLHQVTEKLRGVLQQRLAVIGVLAAIAPLLGLLGTVLGMIQTFQVIALFGTSNAKAMAGGISVALITTQTGLLIAIPGLFISGTLGRRANRLESGLDEMSLAMGRVLDRDGATTPDGPQGSKLNSMEASAT